MSKWHNDTLRCSRDWLEYLTSNIIGKDNSDHHRKFSGIVSEIVDVLSTGYVRLSGNPHLPFNEVYVYKQMLEHLHKLSHAHIFYDLGLSPFFMLGNQLALRDLTSVDKYEEYRTSETESEPYKTKFENVNIELPDSVFPDFVSEEFRKTIIHLFKHRALFVDRPTSFAPGGWIQLFLALLFPERHPSILWLVPDPDSPKRSNLIVAGKHSLRPAAIHLKHQIDQALKILTVHMGNDKESGLAPAECGWMPCAALWPNRERSTMQDARQKLTTLAAPMGQLEYIKGTWKDHPRCGQLRLPEIWASSETTVRISTE